MDKKTMLKVFGDAFLRSFAVLLALVIVGFAVFFIVRVNTNGKQVAENTTEEITTEEITTEEITTEEITTEEVTTEEVTTEEITTEEEIEEIPSVDKKVIVLNSTSVAGLAKKWSDKLVGSGFSNVIMGNYTSSLEQTKIYVAEEGMGNDLLEYFPNASIEIGKPDAGSYKAVNGASDEGVEIYIVIGSADTTVQ